MKNNWNDWKNKLINSPNDIEIFEINQNKNCVQDNTVMEIITKNVSHIVVNKYLRILGTSNNMYENIIDFSNTFMENYEDGKYIVAHDVFGGLFASEKTIRYFSPDNLQWEDLGVNYEEFINWISEEDINDFYQPFLWEDANTLISEVKTNEGIFIYPFLWTKECDLSTAFKKNVPFKDLLDNNFDSKSKLK